MSDDFDDGREQVKRLAAQYNASWREKYLTYPHDIVEQLIVVVIVDHPEIDNLLYFRAEELLHELGLTIPPGVGLGSVLGHAKEGIVWVRTRLKSSEFPDSPV